MGAGNQERIEWGPAWELGLEDIDLQHHFFANLINRLAAGSGQPMSLDSLQGLLDELSAYARFHFVSEENAMLRWAYPQREAHAQHHRQLIDQLSARATLLRMRGAEGDVHDVVDFLVSWFMGHTHNEDRQFVDFVLASGRAP